MKISSLVGGYPYQSFIFFILNNSKRIDHFLVIEDRKEENNGIVHYCQILKGRIGKARETNIMDGDWGVGVE